MDQSICQNYIAILREELRPALGCTEPIAIAYAAARAKQVLGCEPQLMKLHCSGNIVKNVKGVTVPGSGGMKGIEAAAILGVTGGEADRELEVLEAVTPEDIERTQQLIREKFCICDLIEGVENLHIIVELFAGSDTALVEIRDEHTNIIRIEKNGEVLLEKPEDATSDAAQGGDKSLLNVKDILEFARTTDLGEVRGLLERQVELNTAISQEGMLHPYGAAVGKTLRTVYGNDIKTRAKAAAAAGSDARMSGCAMPVVINSGSGNQGITASLPVVEFANELGVPREKLLRALIISNLIAVHQKRYIGSLSAFCGVVSAATGSGAAITYLHGGGYDEIANTIVNTLANIGGMVCDGAKPSCAAKIAAAVDTAIMGHYLSMAGSTFAPGEGLVKRDVEETIRSFGRVGREGMRSTDTEILNIMLDR